MNVQLLFLKKFIFVYIVTMPFTFVHDFGYWTALFSTFMLYVLRSPRKWRTPSEPTPMTCRRTTWRRP
jgi:hypothetical protein